MVSNQLFDMSWKLKSANNQAEGKEVVSAPDEKQALVAIKRRLKNRAILKEFDIDKGEFIFDSAGKLTIY